MKWLTPPVKQGQIVEEAFSASVDEDGYVWMRRTDRSDRSVRLFRADLGASEWDPANTVPVGLDWEEVMA